MGLLFLFIYYFLYSWMINLYLVTCFSCDNMTYRLGGAILSCINDIHVHNLILFFLNLDKYNYEKFFNFCGSK